MFSFYHIVKLYTIENLASNCYYFHMETTNNKKKTLWEMVKFAIVGGIFGLIQLVLVNVFALIADEGAQWPYFVSNLIANICGYFQNRKTTFKAENVPKWCMPVYIIVISAVIIAATPLQAAIVRFLRTLGIGTITALAPTIAACTAGFLQFCILFPLEKFVLFKDRSSPGSKEE